MATKKQAALAQTHLFTRAVDDFTLSSPDRAEVTLERARVIATSFDLSVHDVLTCSEKFWESTLDPLNTIDGAASALWTIQVNLACGTISEFTETRPELKELCRKILAFEVSAHYMLTEVDHGLDSQNIETTATLLDDGSFEVHTPTPGAAKFMPSSLPVAGVPRVAIVMARLVVKGKDRGIRPFAVPLNDGRTMYPGISCRELPHRSGTRPIAHAITYFDRVNIPSWAFIGDFQTSLHPRIQFLRSIWRLGIGSATISSLSIPAMRVMAQIVTQFARLRKVTDSSGKVVPIISFRTTQIPILRALAQADALEALYKEIRPYFSAADNSKLTDVINIRNGLADVFKTVTVHHYRETSITLTDRLGARGLFTENQLIALEMELRGMTIAEGDVTVLCIRLASELLMGRYTLPPARHPEALLARHEQGLMLEMTSILKSFGSKHRSENFNQLLLPRSVALVVAIGHRMAYEAALDAPVMTELVALYEATAVMHDLAWYVENGLLTRQAAISAETDALSGALPLLDQLLEKNGCAPYVHAPAASHHAWDQWVASLPLLENHTARARL